jgi:hypothetical protein
MVLAPLYASHEQRWPPSSSTMVLTRFSIRSLKRAADVEGGGKVGQWSGAIVAL